MKIKFNTKVEFEKKLVHNVKILYEVVCSI